VDQSAVPVGAEAAKSPLPLAYLTLVDADAASDAVVIFRWRRRQTEFPSGKRMEFLYLVPDIREARSDAIDTESQIGRDQIRFFAAKTASGCHELSSVLWQRNPQQ
jgi:hypothetical protein